MLMNKTKSKICFVLLPGFSSDDMQALGLKKILEKSGYDAVASNFYGEKIINDFSALTTEECLNNISETINRLSDKYEQVFGIGISLGGAFLMEHAKKFDNLNGIVSVGTPFRLKKRKLISLGQWFFPLIYLFWRPLQKIQKLRLSPIGASKEIIGYLEGKFLENLRIVTVPILFLHSKKDGVADYRALEEYVPRVGSEKKEITYFKNGNHVIDDNPEIIVKHALKFFELE